jgi:glycine/sarcosine N-methyltransferase
MTTLLKNIENNYDTFAEYFDLLFDDVDKLTTLEGEAIERIIRPYNVQTILDCACGTGIQSIGLAKRGYRVSASDISSAMINCLRDKLAKEELNIENKVSDFRNLTEWNSYQYDAVISLGNNLTLLQDRNEIAVSLASMRKKVNTPGGVILVGMHDYYQVKDSSVPFLIRKIQNTGIHREVIFDLREFSEERAIVTYFILYQINRSWKLITDTKSYLLLSVDELCQEMTTAGFKNLKLFDITGRRPYKKNDEWVIILGTL